MHRTKQSTDATAGRQAHCCQGSHAAPHVKAARAKCMPPMTCEPYLCCNARLCETRLPLALCNAVVQHIAMPEIKRP
eukprot:6583684-Lingulodinium_polyedra.AAC.1